MSYVLVSHICETTVNAQLNGQVFNCH